MLPLKSFYLMRHGQSADNALGLISGAGSDPHLTLKGYKQAEMAAIEFLSLDPRPEKIIASGLVRAVVTARIVGGIPVLQDPELNERHLGELDGKISEADQKSRGQLPGEESADAHRSRVMNAIATHLSGSDETILFVCHGGTIRRIFEALGLPAGMEIRNAKIYSAVPSPRAGWEIAEV